MGIIESTKAESRPRSGGQAQDTGRLRSAEVIVRAFLAANSGLRARILDRMLRSVGTLASAVLGGGIFLRFVSQVGSVSPDDAAGVSAAQFLELARYVEQSNPGAFQQAMQTLLQDPSVLTAVGVAAAAAAVHLLGRVDPRRR